MKIKIDINSEYDDLEIIIKTKEMNESIEKLYHLIQSQSKSLIVKKDSHSYAILINDIYYIESIDDKTFIYLEDDIFEIQKRLYELENNLSSNFVRISKSIILNIDKLSHVKAIINGKYEAYLINNEKLIVSRHYVRSFKKKFGIGD